MEIESIKDKVLKNDFKLTKVEQLTIVDVYAEITKISTGKAKILNIGCQGCLLTAYTVIQNYIKYHMNEVKAKAVVEVKIVEEAILGTKTYKQLISEAKNRGITHKGNISKQDLIKLLE
jgi:hypothetical protein